jgi:alkanesulfonate monooxygenase SsuD/methylene tetrahydromethanopterin reductase-like flavin-dependent oxidoreductase (luciferase family)
MPRSRASETISSEPAQAPGSRSTASTWATSGPKARNADVWNAAGGSPEEVAASSTILDQHCADVGRDPSQIRRSVQFRVGIDEMDQVRATTDGYVTVGVTDFLLIVQGADPVAIGERLAAHLPRLRELG